MSTNVELRHERARKLLERLIKIAPDPLMRKRALKMHYRMKAMPLYEVLAKVEGNSVIEKAGKIGVTRQAYYDWLRGHSRPSLKHARVLAKITGYDVDAIRGRGGGRA